MYLHLGSDFVIKNTDIIAIFNIRNQKNLKIICKSSAKNINTRL